MKSTLKELSAARLVIESRESRDHLDRQVIAAMQRQGKASLDLVYDHQRPYEEPSDWDSAVRRYSDQVSRAGLRIRCPPERFLGRSANYVQPGPFTISSVSGMYMTIGRSPSFS